MAFAKVILALVLLSSAALTTVQGFRVLGLFPFNGRSHHVMFKALMEVLADRGHEVVMVSTFPQKQPYANYTDLDLSKHFPSLVNTFNFDHVTSFKRAEVIRTIGMEWAGADLCRRVFKTREFQDLMAGEYGQFDVVLTEVFGSDCWAVVPYKMQVPNVGVVTTPDLAWMHERMGSVDNPSFLPVSNQPYAGKLNLWHRLQNVYAYVISKVLHKWYIEDPTDVMLREIFGADTPLSVDLVRNTSLLLLNCHPSVNPARPVPPNVVFAGGLHLKNTRPDRTGSFLAPDLRAWMDGAEHGVILFSLGSLVQSSTLPRDAIDGLLQAFADLPQRVLWKYEKEDLVLPPNVRTAAWVPQSDVLAHPKTILFITHGGLMGTTEALFLGVPMLGIPLFGDQRANMAQYKELGIAERLDHADLTKDNVLTVVRKMTATDSYRARSSMVATRFSDRPRSAGAEAAWWIEYVVRHQGAPHLRPLGADLPLYQYLLLDVVAIFLAGVVTMLVLARFLLMKFILKITMGAKAKQH